MTEFTDRLHELSEQLYQREHRSLALYGDKSHFEVQMHEIDEEIELCREVVHDLYEQLHKLVTDRIGYPDDEVDEYIDWQLTRCLSGQATLENVMLDINQCCNRLANAAKVRLFPVG